jgi:6-phosphofructokinase 1
LEDLHDIKSKVCILGHIQRGGSPVGNDRFYGSIMGVMAVETLFEKNYNHAIVVRNTKVQAVPLKECSQKSDHVMHDYEGITEALSI